ncbi:T9SS type A sorting domain-containing protein [bacterium]|nr:T9SS type A sorting domain-containing protein [bacterium]
MKKNITVFLEIILVLVFVREIDAIFLEKSYIGVGAEDNGLLTIGIPNDSCPNYIDLTCCNYCMGGGGLGLSHTTFMIDRVIYTNDIMSPYGIPLVLVTRTANISDSFLVTEWEDTSGDIRMRQELIPIDVDSTEKGYVTIKYMINNEGTVPHEVGVLICLDLKVGSSCPAGAYIPGGTFVDTTAIFEGSAVPLFWYCYACEDTLLKAFAALGISPFTLPDRMAIGQAHLILAVLWEPDFIPIGSPFDNMAVAYWWFPVTIAPGECIELMTSLGTYEGLTGIEEESIYLPISVELHQNYPNPFNSSTVIFYSLPTHSEVKFEVYNVLGEKVEILVDEKQARGTYLVKWQPDDLGSGIYFGRLQTNGIDRVISILYIK